MKKIICIALALAMLLSMAACGETTQATQSETTTTVAETTKTVDPIVYRIGTQGAADSPQVQGLQKFADLVNERTEGRVEIEIYDTGVLGTEAVMRDMVEEGSLEMCSIGYTIMGAWYGELYLPQILFGFNSNEEEIALMTGEYGQKYLVEPMLKDHNIRVLDQIAMAPRTLCSKNAVYSLADMNGLKLRIPTGLPVREECYKRLGVNAVGLALTDTYTAISQGTCDAVELPMDSLDSYHFYEVCDYVIDTNHMYYSNAVMINEDSFQKMTAEDQEVFKTALREGIEYGDEVLADALTTYQAKFEQNGVTFITLDDSVKQEMSELCSALYTDPDYCDAWGTEAAALFESEMAKIRK